MNKKLSIHPEVKKYLPTVEAVTTLMYPFIEAAIHDLTIGKVVALYNNISKREIGDRSPLEELKTPVKNFPDYFEPYYKENYDGRKLKCTSITIRDEKNKPVGLICFNFDTSFFADTRTILETFLKVKDTSDNPIDIFDDNYKDKIKSFVDEFLRENHSTIDNLSRKQKKEIVNVLFQKGVFNYKNAANYIAEVLDISRATVYNYIK